MILDKLAESGLKISPKKTIIDTSYHGIKFLGKVTYPYGYQKQAKHSAARLMNAARNMTIDDKLLSRLNSQIGRLKHYSCFNLKEDFMKELPEEVWDYVFYNYPKEHFIEKKGERLE